MSIPFSRSPVCRLSVQIAIFELSRKVRFAGWCSKLISLSKLRGQFGGQSPTVNGKNILYQIIVRSSSTELLTTPDLWQEKHLILTHTEGRDTNILELLDEIMATGQNFSSDGTIGRSHLDYESTFDYYSVSVRTVSTQSVVPTARLSGNNGLLLLLDITFDPNGIEKWYAPHSNGKKLARLVKIRK